MARNPGILSGQAPPPGVVFLGVQSKGKGMAQPQLRVLASARNTVMVVDDQSPGRALLEQVIRSLDERVHVEGFARPTHAVVWATRHVSALVLVPSMRPLPA